MKISKRQLRRIIREEKQKILVEARIRHALPKILKEVQWYSDDEDMRVSWEIREDGSDEWVIDPAEGSGGEKIRGSGLEALEAEQDKVKGGKDEELWNAIENVIDKYHDW
jgi:flavin-dependent dehydrogenase